ncbi:unnamed protein product [Closterium sp. NIES-53]
MTAFGSDFLHVVIVAFRCRCEYFGIDAVVQGLSQGVAKVLVPESALCVDSRWAEISRTCFNEGFLSTTLTPLPAPVPVRLADPSGGQVVASSSTVLPCLAVPSGSLSGLHLPSFSTNLVSTAALQDAMVTTTTPRGSSLYTLATEPPQVAASAQVSASGQVAASCSCRLLSHQTLLWHHRLGHPSLQRLRGMHSRLLVSGLPSSLPPLPPSPAPPCLPCVKGRQHAAPHSSSFPPTTAPLQTLHMDVLPLAHKGDVSAVLIPWIRTVRLQLRERFGQDLPVPRLHSDRGGEFSSDLLRDFCRGEGITQSFMLPDSPQQNGIAERRIGLVIEVARTSMIHAGAPHFLWPFAVHYAAHQLNLWPRVSLPDTSPTLRWTGKVGDVSVFRVWFYHHTSRRVLPSQDVTFDESVLFYRLFPYRSAPSPPPPLFLAPGPPPVDPLPPQGPAPSGVSQVDPLLGIVPVQVAIVSGAAPGATYGGAASEGAEPGGAGSEGTGSGGAEPEGVEPGGAESEGAEPEGAESEGAESRGAKPRAGEPGGAGAGGAAVTIGVGDPTEPGAAGAGGAGAGVAGVGGPGAGCAGAEVVGPGAGGAGGTVRPRPYFTQPLLQPASPLHVPSPYTEQSGGLTERREPSSRPVSPVRTARLLLVRVLLLSQAHTPWHSVLPLFHCMFLCLLLLSPLFLWSLTLSLTKRVLPVPLSLVFLPLLSLTRPLSLLLLLLLLLSYLTLSLDYASALVAESVPASPPSVAGECALGTDVLEDTQEVFDCLAAAVPRFASLLLATEGDPDAPDIPSCEAEIYAGAMVYA